MNYLEEGLYRSFLEGVIFVSLVTLTDTSAELCILGDVGVSCHSSTDRECFYRQLPSSENYENVIFGKL